MPSFGCFVAAFILGCWVFSLDVSSRVAMRLSADINDTDNYSETFDKGYEPFTDESEVSPEKEEILANAERCSIMFAKFLKENKDSLKKTLPDLPTKVSIMLIVTNIFQISEKDQTVTLTMFIEFSWRDRRFLDATDEQCSTLPQTVPNFSEIWFPIWTIENSAERTLYYEAWENFPAVIYNRSYISWITSFRIVVNCPMKMEYFPFDVQNCYLLIRSPHYFIEDLQYYVYGRDQAILLWNENVSHPLWDITGQMARPAASNVSGIELWFRLERKPDFYIWTLIIPTSLISMSTFLAFLLPSHSEEKVQTILGGILSYFVLMLTLHDLTPQGSDPIPVVTLFYVILIALGIFGSVICAVIVRVANIEKARAPRFKMGKLLLNKRQFISANDNKYLASDILNDTFLCLYVLSVFGIYFWLFKSTLMMRDGNLEADSKMLNYTPIQFF